MTDQHQPGVAQSDGGRGGSRVGDRIAHYEIVAVSVAATRFYARRAPPAEPVRFLVTTPEIIKTPIAVVRGWPALVRKTVTARHID